MIGKEQLSNALELRCKGKAFQEFRKGNTFISFLAYDSDGCWNIRVKLDEFTKLTSFKEVVFNWETLISASAL